MKSKVIILRTLMLFATIALLFHISNEEKTFTRSVEVKNGRAAKIDPCIYDIKKSYTLIGLIIQKEYPTTHNFIRFSVRSVIHSQATIIPGIKMEHIFISLGLLLFLFIVVSLTFQKELMTKITELKTRIEKLKTVVVRLDLDLENLRGKKIELEKKIIKLEGLKFDEIRQITMIRDEFYLKLKVAKEDVRNKLTAQFLNQTFIPELHRCQKSVGNRDVDKEDDLLKKYMEELIETEALANRYMHHLRICDVFPSINFIDLITIMVKRIAKRRGFMANVITYFIIDFDLLEHSAMINLFHNIAEVLEHCVKPANATVVTLEFRIEEQSLVIAIRDNEHGGILMSSNGIGFMYTYNRTYPLPGKFIIDSTPGERTTLKISIP